ncbi:MAG: DUF3558 family protein, partial [Pseudonocardiaceae bacterium]
MILLAGCAAGTGASPGPPQQNPNKAMSPIPLVKNPRDAATMARRPCELLTTQQARKFGLDLPPKQREGLFGTSSCGWKQTTNEREIIRTVDIS